MKLLSTGLVIIAIIIFLFACNRAAQVGLVEGGIYSIESGKGDIGIAKVLVLDGDTIHIRVYKNHFSSRPKTIDPIQLTLGTIHDKDGAFGIGHLPIRTAEFISWKPELIMKSEVDEKELDGYKEWKDAGGGVWGK
jgi:hypothetical protein